MGVQDVRRVRRLMVRRGSRTSLSGLPLHAYYRELGDLVGVHARNCVKLQAITTIYC